jgi:hypothetical protein
MKALRRHEPPGLPDHHQVAVDAGVVALAETMGRRKDQGPEFFGDIQFHQVEAQMGRGLPGPVGPVERRDKANQGDFEALVPQQRRGQHAVQTAGKKTQGADFLSHLVMPGSRSGAGLNPPDD